MLATQCPHCQTRFRVNSTQLKLRQGMVRCGQCRNVFNGIDYLIYTDDDAAEVLEIQQHAPPQISNVANLETALEFPESEVKSPPEPFLEAAITDTLDPPISNSAFSEENISNLDLSISQEKFSETIQQQKTDAEDLDMLASTSEELQRASFLEPESSLAPASSLYTWLFILGLILLLGQGIYVFRNNLAAYWPATKPWLGALCDLTRCTVSALQQSDAIIIEASDLQSVPQQKDIYIFNLTLRNRSHFAQQLPAIELWLTNVQNKPIVRRVFLPQVYAATQTSFLDTGLMAESEIVIKLYWKTESIEASGYRVYLFYP